MATTETATPVELPGDWDACERGNTWLVEADADSAGHVGWFDLPDGRRLEVCVNPGNSPGFTVRVLTAEASTDAHLAAHINDRLVGWSVRKCDIAGVEVGDDGRVAAVGECEICGRPEGEEHCCEFEDECNECGLPEDNCECDQLEDDDDAAN